MKHRSGHSQLSLDNNIIVCVAQPNLPEWIDCQIPYLNEPLEY
jgi:hypothetical protein